MRESGPRFGSWRCCAHGGAMKATFAMGFPRRQPVFEIATGPASVGGEWTSVSSDKRVQASTRAARRGHWVGLCAVLVLAIGVRFVHLGHASFCHMEAWRAHWMQDGGWKEARRFPPLLFATGKVTQSLFGKREVPLRLPFALAGVACVVVAYGFCRTSLGVESALMTALIIAVHPILVYYSRKQLEYSFEALWGIAVLWAGHAAYREPRIRRFALFGLAALGAFSSSFTGSLVVGTWLPLILWSAFRQHTVSPRALRGAVVLTFVVALIGLAWYTWLSGVPDRGLYDRYYDTVEPVWPVSHSLADLSKWLIGATASATGFVLAVYDTWSPLNWIVAAVCMFLVAASIPVLWRRCRVILLIYLLVYLELTLAGAMRLWPFGGTRHVIFLIPLATIGVGTGLAHVAGLLRRSPATLLLLGTCLAVPAVRAVRSTVISPAAYEHSRPAFDYVVEHRQPGDALFVYYFAADAFRFYWHDDGMPVFVQHDDRRGDLRAFAEEFDAWIQRHDRVWIVFAHDWKGERERWLAHLSSRYDELDRREFNDASVHLLVTGDTENSPCANEGQRY